MKLACDFLTVKSGKRSDRNNPITNAFLHLEQGIKESPYELSKCNGDDADVVFVFGSITQRKMDTERAKRILKHREEGKIIFSLDSAFYSTYIRNSLKSSETQMFRIGLGDCTGQGNFLNENSDSRRFEWFKKAFNFQEKPFNPDPEAPILFILQSERGWQYDNTEPYFEWAKGVVEQIRWSTDRRIILRAHPNTDRHPTEWIAHGFKNIEITRADRQRRSLFDDLRRSGSVVTHSSSGAIESYVEGIPTFALDPRCVIHKDVEKDLFNLNNPFAITTERREQNFYDWAYTSWMISEMSNPSFIEYYVEKANDTNHR